MDSGDKGSYVRNMAYAAFAGQAGCSSASLVLGALLLGLWIDSLLGTKPVFVLILIILSVPLSLYVMVRMVLGAVSRIPPPNVPAAKARIDDEDEE